MTCTDSGRYHKEDTHPGQPGQVPKAAEEAAGRSEADQLHKPFGCPEAQIQRPESIASTATISSATVSAGKGEAADAQLQQAAVRCVA